LVSITVDNSILLRSFEPADADALFGAVNSAREHLHPWLNWVDKTLKPEHSLQFIQKSLEQLEAQEALALGVFYEGKLVGGIGMHAWEQATRRAQLGYWITREYEGKGIINKSLIKFIDFLFSKTDLNKIEIHFVTANERSAKVAERLGFKIEGIIRQSFLRNGVAEDLVITGLLKSEWPKKSQ
jgi:ribosomal-protein-serine acetyltransferase